MVLEFELKVIRISETNIVYEVQRKGYATGLLVLDEPYTLKQARITKIRGE